MNAEPNEEGYFLSQIPKPKPPRQTKKLSSIIPRVLNRYGITNQLAALELENAWGEIVGPMLLQETRLGHVQRGVLLVLIKNNLVLQELTMRKKEILARLQNFPAFSEIRDLRLRLEMF